MTKGWLYLIQHTSNGTIKIGRTGNLEERMKKHTSKGYKLIKHIYVENIEDGEKAMKEYIKEKDYTSVKRTKETFMSPDSVGKKAIIVGGKVGNIKTAPKTSTCSSEALKKKDTTKPKKK